MILSYSEPPTLWNGIIGSCGPTRRPITRYNCTRTSTPRVPARYPWQGSYPPVGRAQTHAGIQITHSMLDTRSAYRPPMRPHFHRLCSYRQYSRFLLQQTIHLRRLGSVAPRRRRRRRPFNTTGALRRRVIFFWTGEPATMATRLSGNNAAQVAQAMGYTECITKVLGWARKHRGDDRHATSPSKE